MDAWIDEWVDLMGSLGLDHERRQILVEPLLNYRDKLFHIFELIRCTVWA